MPKPIAVALGDIHLDTKIWTKLPSVTGDAEAGYAAFLEVARRLQVPAIIVGDLFDVAKPVPALVQMHRRLMDKCQREQVKVLVLQGNHDKQSHPWATASHDWPLYVGDGTPFQLGPHQATALDYASMDVIEGRVRRVTTPLLFLHQAVRQALGFENAWNCDLDWVPDAVKLTVMGDIHKPMDFDLAGSRKACYTGAGHARDIDQTGTKSVLVIYDDLSYSREIIHSRLIKKFYVKSVNDVTDINTWLALTKAVQQLPPLLWVVHTAEMAAHVSTLRSQVTTNGLVLMHTEPLIDDTEDATSAVIVDEDDISPAKLLSKIVDQEKDKELFSFVAELVDDRRELPAIITDRKAAC